MRPTATVTYGIACGFLLGCERTSASPGAGLGATLMLLTANGVEYRRDSRLLLADPRTPETPPDCASCGTPAYCEWRNGRFEPVGPGSHLHLGGPRPWPTERAPSDTGLAARTGPYTCPR